MCPSVARSAACLSSAQKHMWPRAGAIRSRSANSGIVLSVSDEPMIVIMAPSRVRSSASSIVAELWSSPTPAARYPHSDSWVCAAVWPVMRRPAARAARKRPVETSP